MNTFIATHEDGHTVPVKYQRTAEGITTISWTPDAAGRWTVTGPAEWTIPFPATADTAGLEHKITAAPRKDTA